MNKGEERVKAFLKAAKIEAEETKQALIDEAKADASMRLKNIEAEAKLEIQTKERLLSFEKRQAELFAKQNTIDEIFEEVRIRIEGLEGKELLAFVTNQIKGEKVNSDEVMRTNKNNYKRYLKALSTSSEAELVDLDLLNKALGTKFKLSNEPVKISNGFILEGKYFDINFSSEELIEKLKNKHLRQLVKELFE